MIDLTPLDVRNKRGDFKKLMRGYDPQEVDVFLELVAERLEALVRENIQFRDRTQTLQQQVTSQLGREQAVQDALVTAQELRADIKAQSQREAEYILKEAETEARRVIAEAEAQVRGKLRAVERQIDGAQDVLVELERRRERFLKDFRALLDRELDVVGVEEGRTPLEERTIDLDLGPAASGRDAPKLWVPERLHPEEGADEVDADRPDSDRPEANHPDGDRSHRIAGDPARREADEGVEGRADDHAIATGGRGGASLPSELETPTFETRSERAPLDEDRGGGYDDLAASMEAEAMAEAQSQVVEVRGADGEDAPEVPRLEQVLAEAGAELVEVPSATASGARERTEKIEPPRIDERGDPTILLYPDDDDSGR
jgi:DivIVA domain-containing protein